MCNFEQTAGAKSPTIRMMDYDFPSLRDAKPEGWRELRKQALQAKDPAQLNAIIQQLNALLSEHERKSKSANQREYATLDGPDDAGQEQVRDPDK